jgi:hypothetical protein
MLIHWQIIHSHGVNADDGSDGSTTYVLYYSLPLLFSTQDTYDQLLSLFQHSTDDLNDLLHYDFLCSKERCGEYRFLEAVKGNMHQTSKSTKFQNKKHQKLYQALFLLQKQYLKKFFMLLKFTNELLHRI